MLIVLDRSGSMWGEKWTAAREAIRTFTARREGFMRFGLHVFPAPGDECGDGTSLVRCDFYAAEAIDLALDPQEPAGSTPTGAAVARAGRQRPDMTDTARPRFLVLITDGDPTCPDSGDGEGNVALAVAAIEELARNDIRTFVIGFGVEASPEKLDRMAVAGGMARVGATCTDPRDPASTLPCKYYEALDHTSLTVAFDAVARAAGGELGNGRSCDDSCYGAGGCPPGEICNAKIKTYSGGRYTLNVGTCVRDACRGVSCPADQFCREGKCVHACVEACDLPKICRDGACVEDPCAEPGMCHCGKTCARHLSCVEGACVDNPCRYITCPETAPFCERGSCYRPTAAFVEAPDSPDAASAVDASAALDVTAPVGCGCGASTALDVLLLAVALSPAAVAARRRSRRPP
jgi:hypothetical protein